MPELVAAISNKLLKHKQIQSKPVCVSEAVRACSWLSYVPELRENRRASHAFLLSMRPILKDTTFPLHVHVLASLHALVEFIDRHMNSTFCLHFADRKIRCSDELK